MNTLVHKSMMTSLSQGGVFSHIRERKTTKRTYKEGIMMLRHLKEEERVQMPLHLQIVFLLNLWSLGENESVKTGFDQYLA